MCTHWPHDRFRVARKAEAVAEAEEGGPRFSMSEVVADIFDERQPIA
jgi:hypothetical protein